MSVIRFSCIGLASIAAVVLFASPGIAQEAPPETPNDCAVKEFTYATSVVDKEPVDTRLNFRIEDENVYAFVRMSCTKVKGDLHFIFFRDEAQYADIPVKPYVDDNVRLWAHVTARPGDWTLDAVLDGVTILEDSFTVYDEE